MATQLISGRIGLPEMQIQVQSCLTASLTLIKKRHRIALVIGGCPQSLTALGKITAHVSFSLLGSKTD